MKNKLFSKEFWNKKRVITASAVLGVAVVAVAVAVPVALTAQSVKSNPEDGASTGEQIQIISKDMTANADYTQDVPYGTPLNELNKLAPEVPGYGPGKLDEQKTTYTDNTDVGTEGIVAVYSYVPLSEQEAKKSKLELKVSLVIQKAYVEKYEYTVPGTRELIGPVDEWETFDISQLKLPKGLVIEKDSAEYYVTGINKKLESKVLVANSESNTPITFEYKIKTDKNHYGPGGVLNVNYISKRKKFPAAEHKILQLITLKKGSSNITQVTMPQLPGFTSVDDVPILEKPVRQVALVYRGYSIKSGNDQKLGPFVYVALPYIYYENNPQEALTNLQFSFVQRYGTPLAVEPPQKIEGYEEWKGPVYQLTKTLDATANNYDPNYADKTKKINKEDTGKLPANSEYSVTYNAKIINGTDELNYGVNVKVTSASASLPSKYDLIIKNKSFGEKVSATVNKKPDEVMGKNANFDISSPTWTVGAEGSGEVGIFVKDYQLKNQTEIELLPADSIVYTKGTAQIVSDNFSGGTLYEEVTTAYKTSAASENQKIKIKYNQDVTDITVLANAFPYKPEGYTAPVLQAEYTTYKKGLLPSQTSYVVYKYESNTPGTEPIYKIYQVEVQKETAEEYLEGTVPKRLLESGSIPKEPTAQELGLPTEWKIDRANTQYHSGTTIDEANKITAEQVKALTNRQTFTAVYRLITDSSRYEDKQSTYKIEYTVIPPSPTEIIFKKQQPAFNDQTNKTWTAKTAPAAPAGWWYVRSHYLRINADSSPAPFRSVPDQTALKQAIEASTAATLEIIWTYVNSDGKWLWIVTPYGLSADLDSYYKNNNANKAAPVSGTKVTFFDQVIGVSLKGTTPEAIAANSSDKSYKVDKPAGTVLEISYKTSDESNITSEMIVQKLLLTASNSVGRFKLHTYGQELTPAASRSVPSGFGKKAGSVAEYAFAVLQITGQTNERPGIYVTGFIETDQAKISDLVKTLPSGTTFTISWSAEEISDNYAASGKQYLIDTYVIAD